MNSVHRTNISDATVDKYITYGEEAFMLTRVKRYNVKGRKYIGTLIKSILKTWVFEMPDCLFGR